MTRPNPKKFTNKFAAQQQSTLRELGILIGQTLVGCEKFTLDLTAGCEHQWFSQAIERYSVRRFVIKKFFGKSTKILSVLSDPESLDGSPTDLETINKEIKARETRLTRKQYVPQYGRQFFYRINRQVRTLTYLPRSTQIQNKTHQNMTLSLGFRY